MEDWCIKEEKRIKDLEYNFKITKFTRKEKSIIEGIDSLGKVYTFKFVNINPLREIAEPGAILIKNRGSLEFKIIKDRTEYTIEYECKSNGKLVEKKTLPSQ